MSFVPTSGTRVQAGLGITATNLGNVTQVATNLVGSASVSITPIGGNTLQLTASAPGTLNTVTTGNGSGITATLGVGAVNLTSALVAGAGIQLIPSGANKNLEVKNILTAGSLTGSGITVAGPIPLPGELRYNVEANLQAGTGIQITNSGINTSKTLSNTGVTSVAVGTGLTTSGATGNITLNNTGITSVAVGAGLTTSGATGNITLNNTGVLSVAAGSGVSISGTATNPIISAGGVNSQRSKAFAATPAAPVSPTQNVPFVVASIPISVFGSLANTFQVGITVNYSVNMSKAGGGGTLRFYLQTIVGTSYDPSVSIETYDEDGWSSFFGTFDTGGYHSQILMGSQTGSGFIYLLGITNADTVNSPFTCNSCSVNMVGSTSVPS